MHEAVEQPDVRKRGHAPGGVGGVARDDDELAAQQRGVLAAKGGERREIERAHV